MYYFIINPVSGSGRGAKVWAAVKSELDRLHIDYRAFLLTRPGEARKLAEGFASLTHPATIIAVGGDGTINDILNGLTSFQNITFGCIPTGSGNDFVRGLNLPKDSIAALHMILNPKQIDKINVGCATSHFPSAAQPSRFSFAVSSGVGFDAAVCYSVQKSRLKKMLNLFHSGKLIYLFTALWLLLTMKCLTLEVSVDGGPKTTYKNVYFAAAMNLRYEGGGFQFCPDALPGDDYLDLIIACDISRPRVLTVLPLAFSGKHIGHHGVHILRCRKADITAPQKLHLHTDGETPGLYQNFSFTLHKEKLAVITR